MRSTRLNCEPGLAGLILAAALAAVGSVRWAPKAIGAEFTVNPHTAFPAAGALNVCPDTPLRLVFGAPPTLGPAGKIEIHDAADNSVVEAIDVASPTATKTIGGLPGFNYYPVILTGNEAAIYPKNGALSYRKTYYVTIDAGVFRNGAEPCAALDRPDAWRFTTKSTPPAAGLSRITVAADGSGDFCTVQGALDFVPEGNTAPVTILIRKGTYTELIFFTGRDAITLLGEDRKLTVIGYANNEHFNGSGGNPYAGSTNPSDADRARGHIYRRGVLLAHRVSGLVISNLTVRNTTPEGGSQAEAIILNGTATARAVIKDVDLASTQDTLQINGQAYVSGSHIEGDVDFMWGTGPCFFENCICRSVRSGAYFTQIRNPGTNHGYVYDRCTFDGAPGVTGNYLSRIDPVRFPHSEVALLDCILTDAVGPVAWLLQAAANAPAPGIGDVHFWEYNSRGPNGDPVDLKSRMPGSRELKPQDDAARIEAYRNPAYVLGNGWNPKAEPIFTAR